MGANLRMMEATFGLTALCDTENNGLLFPSSVSFALDKTDDDDWSKEDGCATETNPLLLLLLPDDDEDDAPSLDLDPNMLAYLAARDTVVFGDDDDDAFGTVDFDTALLEYTDRAEDVRSERNDDCWCCCGLKYFCAVGESERIERDVVIGTYFDFCAAAAAPPAGDDDSDDDDDKDRRVSSLASFRSFSASTSTLLLLLLFGDSDGDSDDDEEASSSSNAFPFTTVFPDFKDVFKSSREGSIFFVSSSVKSSSTLMFTRASSAVFTAEDRSTAPGLSGTSFFPSKSSLSSTTSLFCVVKVDDDDDDVFYPELGASL